MSNITPQAPQSKPARQFNVDRLVPYRKQIALVMVAAGVGFAIYPIWMLIRHSLNVAIGPVFIWSAMLSLISLILGALVANLRPTGKMTESEQLRLLLLAFGALLGLMTALLGFALPILVYSETWAKGLESWREKPAALVWPGLALIGGLAVMFLSLQLGRGMEREHVAVRRTIYGFNAVLMSLLLLAVLALPNVLAYAEPFGRFFGRPYDWTATDVNTISPAMRNMLADLKEPVKVYVLLSSSNLIGQDTRTLLENCRSLSSKLSWEFVEPRAPQNRTRIVGFMERYGISDPQGLLIVRGDESDKAKSDHAFIKVRDLYNQDSGMRPGAPLSYAYTGENALFNALRALIEGKLVIYFTQGHGELTFGSDPKMPPGMRPRQAGGLSALKDKLSERKSVEVKSLTVDRSLKRVPDDASVVVVARPTEAFSPDEVKVLSDYVTRQAKMTKVKDKGQEREEEEVTAGKLFLLLDPIIHKEGGRSNIAPTGVESLLARYKVQLGMNRIESLRSADPTVITALAPPNSPNSIAKAFSPSEDQITIFDFRNVRTVEPAGEGPGGGPSVDQLMIAPAALGVWAETNFDVDPLSKQERLRTLAQEDRAAAFKELSKKNLCLAVAVSESSGGGAPRDMAHAGLTKDTPRMVVFGSAGWISEESLVGGRGVSRMDLFNSCISWLREKASIGQVIPAKKRKEYDLNIPPQDTDRLKWLPLSLMLLGIVGLGTGVWVVRRR
jgi:hypothetical protein